MRLFDLHCDTLYKSVIEDSDFYDDSHMVSLSKSAHLDKYIQFTAVWIPDCVKDYDRLTLFEKSSEHFKKKRITGERVSMYLSAESASFLLGDISNYHLIPDNDIKCISLTWNEENELGTGVLSSSSHGLTDFGRKIVKKLTDDGIIIDVSHASDKLFFDILNNTDSPVIATHSNSRAVTNNKRNLTDEMFKNIRDRGGITGLNFHNAFLNDDQKKASLDDLIRHAEHFLELNGEKTLALGADFDGGNMPEDLKDLSVTRKIYSRFMKEFGKELTDRIFFENASDFFKIFD